MQANSGTSPLLQSGVASATASTSSGQPILSPGSRPVHASTSASSATAATAGAPKPPNAPSPTNQKPQSFLQRILDLPAGHTFLHSVGLKLFTTKKRYQTTPGNREKPKRILETSRYIATTRLAVHLLPITITLFLVGFNATVFVNGPEISTQGQFVLQGAAKLHELTIVGSLAAVILDVIRYQLTREGIELGLLNSAFSFFGLNFLWSQEFFSALRNALRRYRKLFLLSFLVLCCLLAALVGPASALLWLPNPAWLSTGSTELYLMGTGDQLWPQHLTANHTGPKWCGTDDYGDSGKYVCLYGGWDIVRGFVTPEGVSKRSVNMVDAGTHRTMWSWRPFATDTDTWASTVHGASAYLATRLKLEHDNAWAFAKGRQRRLRDATTSGMYVRLIGRIPVARVLCAPCREIRPGPFALSFPILKDGNYWRWENTPGPVKELQLDPLPVSRISAKWISLPPEFGNTTAGLAFVTRNETSPSVGCGCAVDARWAQGQSTLFGDTIRWEAAISPPTIPKAIKAPEPVRLSFSGYMEKSCGPTITADPDWLASISTTFLLGDTRLNVTSTRTNFTTLEAIILKSRLWDVPWLLSDPVEPIQEMEAVLGFYFVNALSRIGWDPQRKDSIGSINPLLRNGTANNDKLLHDNAQPYPRPPADIAATSAIRLEWFNYTTAWQLNDSALYISVAILATHLVIVVLHCVYVLWTRQSSEAWNSIPELIALAYNSKPADDTLENCGAGIMLTKTLGQEVRVVAVGDKEGGPQGVQLMFCEKRVSALVSRVKHAAVQPDTEYS